MNLPYIERIWRVRGSLALDPPQSPATAFGKLDHLFQAAGTTYEIDGDTLTFNKKDPLSQDKMASFNRGTLRVADEGASSTLLYDLNSNTLLFCFALPFFFSGIAWLLEESRTPAFVFAGFFSFLYVVGRILEPWLIRSEFRKSLLGNTMSGRERPVA
ncbi:hypothetical protein [Novosphingobium malaysiense]|uniref:hypothetical protein n=1 Tax=Novosphingobium malaysiense TaxID=1348853 RepID=UPI000689B281|nr:hypothetical protein [Novosphingobium malaysiense]